MPRGKGKVLTDRPKLVSLKANRAGSILALFPCHPVPGRLATRVGSGPKCPKGHDLAKVKSAVVDLGRLAILLDEGEPGQGQEEVTLLVVGANTTGQSELLLFTMAVEAGSTKSGDSGEKRRFVLAKEATEVFEKLGKKPEGRTLFLVTKFADRVELISAEGEQRL